MQFIKTSHVTCISKILTDLCFTKQRIKTKNTFAKVVYRVLVVKMCWQNIQKFVVILEKATIEFKNYFKQIPVPFKFCVDFECHLKC